MEVLLRVAWMDCAKARPSNGLFSGRFAIGGEIRLGMEGSARTECVVLPVGVSSEVNEGRQHRARIKRLCAKMVAPTVAT